MTVHIWYREGKMMSLEDVILRLPTNKLWCESNKRKFMIVLVNLLTTEYLQQCMPVTVHHWRNDDAVTQIYIAICMPDQSREVSRLSQHSLQTLLQADECSKHLLSKFLQLNSGLWKQFVHVYGIFKVGLRYNFKVKRKELACYK